MPVLLTIPSATVKPDRLNKSRRLYTCNNGISLNLSLYTVFEMNASKLVDSFPHDELKDSKGRVVIIDKHIRNRHVF